MEKDATDFRTIPALANYINRIGAEQIGVGRFIVKGESSDKLHYYTERCLITVRPNGIVFCRDKNLAPTKEEAGAILSVVSQLNWPDSIIATPSQAEAQRKKIGAEPEAWLVYHTLDRKGVIMCQERVNGKAGGKGYLPWCLFSDKVGWRQSEPNSLLPFWKPPIDRAKPVMAHEGGKVARFCDNLVNSNEPHFNSLRKRHPWYPFLKLFEHWGWIGGALAPERTNYGELRSKMAGKLVRFICDNDHEGKGALQKIALNYRGQMIGLFFDNSFPEGFDCADELPEDFFEEGRYFGPLLENMDWKGATWATDEMDVDGKVAYKIRREFSKTMAHIVKPDVFIFSHKSNELWGVEEFNDIMAPFSNVKDTAQLIRREASIKTFELTYMPWQPSGPFLDTDRNNKFNCHMPSIIRPKKGDTQMWVEYLGHMFPSASDRKLVEKFIATVIARPQVKMAFGMLLRSETQGVGKSALGEHILAPILGIHNVSFPSEQQVVEGAFNDYLAFKRLIFIHEIYAGASAKAYNKMKPLFTDDIIEINKKYLSTFKVKNTVNIICCSNSQWALRIKDDDRRLLIPMVNEGLLDFKWWKSFHHWLYQEGGQSAILYWASDYGDYFQSGQHAPDTDAKKSFIREQYSAGMDWLANVLDFIHDELKGKREFFTDKDLQDCLQNEVYDGRKDGKMESVLTIRNLAKKEGFFVNPKRAGVEEWGTRGINPHLICIDKRDSLLSPGELVKSKRKPWDVKAFIAKHKKL